jgi:MATE family multidrug resistance protein
MDRSGKISRVTDSPDEPQPETHPFVDHPHRTLIHLSVPVLISLVAEPLTGLVDTAFVARLGSGPLAALGVATTLLSSIVWVFNFLSIGTQTEVAQAHGARERSRGREVASLALFLGLLLGVALCALAWPFAEVACRAMGLTRDGAGAAATYLHVRLLGAPAVLASIAAFGALRGLQDMRTPLRVAVVVNVLNLILDPLLIFGLGPFPRLELAGAAWASTVSQWLGVGLALLAVRRKLGLVRHVRWRDASRLLVVGRDLFLRTGLLLLFLALATRGANRIGTEAGAAHQAVRQVWLLTAFLLDAYAVAAQSLVGYFLAAGRVDLVRRVAAVNCAWSVGTGVALTAAMLLSTGLVARLLVPPPAQGLFVAAWLVAALAQPLNALSFATDGVHWGTGDYRFLRNAMLAATGLGSGLLLGLDGSAMSTLSAVWLITAAWTAVRAAFGVSRIWPGFGAAPLKKRPV